MSDDGTMLAYRPRPYAPERLAPEPAFVRSQAFLETPSPMRFLAEILERPQSERPVLLVPVGYPADSAEVPTLGKQTLDEIATFI